MVKDKALHSWDSGVVTKQPSCTETGIMLYTCSVCGQIKTETIPLVPHSFNSGVVTTEPTTRAEGVITYTCLDCGQTKNETIPVLTFSLGDIGPAGGWVFYDKGYYSDGWRYLEAAPADLRVVEGVPTVDSNVSGYSNATTIYAYGFYRTTDNGSNLFVNGTTTYDAANCTGTAIETGKSNTQLLVNAMGSKPYLSYSGSTKTASYAARLCIVLTHTVNDVTYDDWFLPSRDELNLLYVNLYKVGLGGFGDNNYWSSSEDDSNSINAWLQSFYNGGQYSYGRYNDCRVRPVRAF